MCAPCRARSDGHSTSQLLFYVSTGPTRGNRSCPCHRHCPSRVPGPLIDRCFLGARRPTTRSQRKRRVRTERELSVRYHRGKLLDEQATGPESSDQKLCCPCQLTLRRLLSPSHCPPNGAAMTRLRQRPVWRHLPVRRPARWSGDGATDPARCGVAGRTVPFAGRALDPRVRQISILA